MKNQILFSAALIFCATLLAQAPQGITHQAVMRNAANDVVANQEIGIKVSILQGTAEGTAVYVETHQPESNQNGLITFVIGQGAPASGSFDEIDWGEGPYFLKTEADPEGGTNYSITGTTQFLSVPYALLSQTSADAFHGDMQGNKIVNLADPVNDQDGASKAYVDLLIERLEILEALLGSILPQVSTSDISNIALYSATCGGNVISEGVTPVTARGVVWSISENPTLYDCNGFTIDGAGAGEFISDIIGLGPGITYYVRAYATNSLGTVYGNQMSLSTLLETSFVCGESIITDINGNVYNTIQIGDQCWMKQNLKTTKYRNGTTIEYPYIDNEAWTNNTDGAYAWPENNIVWKNSYGALYNWFAVNNSNGLCPNGWRIPSHDDWTQLEQYVCNFLGNDNCDVKFPFNSTTYGWQGSNESEVLRSCRQVMSPLSGDCNTTEHPRWNESTGGYFGTDDLGFTALPGGYRNDEGIFNVIGNFGDSGRWWTFFEDSAYPNNAWSRSLNYNLGKIYRVTSRKNFGFSVRCIKDGD